MNEYLRRPERVQAMRWTRGSTVELSRWLDERRIGHHFHDVDGSVVSPDGNADSLCFDGSGLKELWDFGYWVTWNPLTEETCVLSDTEFRSQFQMTL